MPEKPSSGVTAGKVVVAAVLILYALIWLGSPNADVILHDAITAAWNNLVRGVIVPVTTIGTQIAVVAALCYVLYLIVRHWRRR